MPETCGLEQTAGINFVGRPCLLPWGHRLSFRPFYIGCSRRVCSFQRGRSLSEPLGATAEEDERRLGDRQVAFESTASNEVRCTLSKYRT